MGAGESVVRVFGGLGARIFRALGIECEGSRFSFRLRLEGDSHTPAITPQLECRIAIISSSLSLLLPRWSDNGSVQDLCILQQDPGTFC